MVVAVSSSVLLLVGWLEGEVVVMGHSLTVCIVDDSRGLDGGVSEHAVKL